MAAHVFPLGRITGNSIRNRKNRNTWYILICLSKDKITYLLIDDVITDLF